MSAAVKGANSRAQELLSNRNWRLQNLYSIQPKEGALQAFRPNWAQRSLLRTIHRRNQILKVRQLGLSTQIEVLIADFCGFNKHQTAGIIDLTLPDGREKMEMIRIAWDNMDNKEIHPVEVAKLGALVKERNPMRFSKERIEWANGSVVRMGMSLRGGTNMILHVSELGKISYRFPERAREIVNGSFETVPQSGFIFCESTHEGGKSGTNYSICKRAMGMVGKKLSPLDWRFHFFPWHNHPEYSMPLPEGAKIRPEIREYFDKLETEHGIVCDDEQQYWYDRKREEKGHGMLCEHPSVPEEAFSAPSDLAIYGDLITRLRAEGSIHDFKPVGSQPFYTFWDLGVGDSTAIWLIQPVGRKWLVLNWFEDCGEAPAHYVSQIRKWEEQYGAVCAGHFLPHDGGNRDRSSLTYEDYLRQLGLGHIVVVPRTSDKWVGINHVRRLLPHCEFHESACDPQREDAQGEPIPSGIACLEGYHRRETGASGIIRSDPAHDCFSHSADAFRTFGEAEERGLIVAPRYISSGRKGVPVKGSKLR